MVQLVINVGERHMGQFEFNKDKVFTEFRDGVSKYEPILGRKYTLTHSDTTGDLFVTIGLNYARDKFGEFRDEVILEWKDEDGNKILYGKVLIDGDGIFGSEKIRNRIFMTEMPLALQAIRYGETEFFRINEELDDSVVLIHFKSNDPYYDKVCNFGNMNMYKTDI